jgi:hypothetical protein
MIERGASTREFVTESLLGGDEYRTKVGGHAISFLDARDVSPK